MDKVMEIYEKLKDRISLEEFLCLVDEKEAQMAGLADKFTAARLVAISMGISDDEKKIGDVTPDLSKVILVGKVTACSDVRVFNREDGSSGNVANLTLADETGSIRVALWDAAADLVKVGDIVFGDSIQVSGFVREGRNGLEVSVGRGGKVDKIALSEDIQVRIDPYKINEVKAGMGNLYLVAKVLDISDPRTFQRKDGSTGKVRNVTLGDATGKIKVTLWDENAVILDKIKPGENIEITGGYAKENSFSNQVEINLGNNSSLRTSSKKVEFKEQFTPIADIVPKQQYNIEGHVTGLDELKEFQRKDGSAAQVLNIHISDDSGRIRAALWGEQADIIHDIDLGTQVQVIDCYAKPGWNDEVELSVGERSRVIIVEKG
ncbi:MAG: OB-fold nucleic acid binding domain-containing protein [Methanosarcinales archaeon]|nr:OB-fold nucleic acid binding domain-containing protein [ANME-2 cluster archaeon]MDF1530712.1 OB-fold nucleic acid binding domain-containing protein [ANME-2 cluster archaeon]MDW7774748.1 OB-fold nucleic acid binding domain-containing protein [Methanosarcinales archaeon]